MNIIKSEDLINKYEHYLTIGQLREFLNSTDLPNDGLVMIERVEDIYYENHSWKVYLKDGDYTKELRETGSDEKDIFNSMNQYHPAFCTLKYPEDKNLFINLHY